MAVWLTYLKCTIHHPVHSERFAWRR